MKDKIVVGIKKTVTSEGFSTDKVCAKKHGTECAIELQKILYALDMMQNLISSRKARRSGFRSSIGDFEKERTKGAIKLTEKRTRVSKMVETRSSEGPYEACIKPPSMAKCCILQTDQPYMWHNRLGHVNTISLN